MRTHDHQLMERHIRRFTASNKVLFATGQGPPESHDYDIYCVVEGELPSSVHIYKDSGVWIELFVDAWSTMLKKIKNSDEIAVSFIDRMNPVLGVGKFKHLECARHLIPKHFSLPALRKNLLLYRLLVLQSKYFGAELRQEKELFRAQMLSPLFILTFDALGRWPDTPKKWIKMIREEKRSPAKNLMKSLNDDKQLLALVQYYISDFQEMHISKQQPKSLTFLG